MKTKIDELAKEFSSKTQGSSDFWKDDVYVIGSTENEFIPFSLVEKKIDGVKGVLGLQASGYAVSSLTYLDLEGFEKWYHTAFNRKLTQKLKKEIQIIHYPDSIEIFKAVEIVDQVYKILKDHKVIVNGKNLPIQLGEWYAKSILGLYQKKSSSQRGFDFYTHDGKKVEVKTHWMDVTSPKGVKLKRSLIEMSDFTVIIYISKNFMIREMLLLDSDFVIRKFSAKGHTIFLKDSDISSYFFSRSNKHYDKIISRPMLMKFASPKLAIQIDDNYQKILVK